MHLVSSQASHAWQVGMVACTALQSYSALHDWLKDSATCDPSYEGKLAVKQPTPLCKG